MLSHGYIGTNMQETARWRAGYYFTGNDNPIVDPRDWERAFTLKVLGDGPIASKLGEGDKPPVHQSYIALVTSLNRAFTGWRDGLRFKNFQIDHWDLNPPDEGAKWGTL